MMTDEPFDEQTNLWLQRRVEAYEKSIRASHKTYKALLRRAAITQLMLDDIQKAYVDAVTVDGVTVTEHVQLALAKPDDPYRKWALVKALVAGTGTATATESAVLAARQMQEKRTQEHRLGAKVRWERSAKTKEIAFVKEQWAKWQADPTLYAGKTDFAQKVLEDCKHLTSEKHITDLCRKWEKL